jgi:antirestriction protein ArdC
MTEKKEKEKRKQSYGRGERKRTFPMDKYQLITDKLLSLIQKGTLPWQKPWFGNPPRNLIGGNAYQGSNPLLLTVQMLADQHQDPYFIGYHQAKNQGWQVTKGSKASWILFAGTASKEVENDEGEKQENHYRVHKWHPIYNIACIDDGDNGRQLQQWKEKYQPNQHTLSEKERIAQAEHFITSTGARIQHGGNVACYSPTSDRINLPHFSAFTSPEAYYATAFHELTHWTGHPTRLNRTLEGRFGSQSYAFEELVAELGAAFLCNDIGIQSHLEHHASYLDSWLNILKKNSKAFFKASQLANQAKDFLTDLREK